MVLILFHILLSKMKTSSSYVVNVTGVSVGEEPTGIRMVAEFYSGSSFTHLLEPAYSVFTKAVSDQTRLIIYSYAV